MCIENDDNDDYDNRRVKNCHHIYKYIIKRAFRIIFRLVFSPLLSTWMYFFVCKCGFYVENFFLFRFFFYINLHKIPTLNFFGCCFCFYCCYCCAFYLKKNMCIYQTIKGNYRTRVCPWKTCTFELSTLNEYMQIHSDSNCTWCARLTLMRKSMEFLALWHFAYHMCLCVCECQTLEVRVKSIILSSIQPPFGYNGII